MAVVIVIAAIMLVAAACGSSSTNTPAPSATATAGGGGGTAAVAISNFTFTPQKITVKVGTTVTWTNNDSVQHTVTSASNLTTSATVTDLFDSGLFGQGQTFSYKFTKAGTYFYVCTIHRSLAAMHGEVIVQ
jgi:plastocyanin